MTTIVPSVGRVMLLMLPNPAGIPCVVGEPLAAIVAGVVDEGRKVNVGFLDHNGAMRDAQNVPVVQEGETEPGGAFVKWMPYQLGQARKEEIRASEPPLWPGAVVGGGVIGAGGLAFDRLNTSGGMTIETKQYSDGSSATGTPPLPDLSPEQQAERDKVAAMGLKPETNGTVDANPAANKGETQSISKDDAGNVTSVLGKLP